MSNRKKHEEELASTELKRMEDALRENEARYRSFIDNSPTIAWMKDTEGRFVFVSKTFESRFGLRLEDVRGTRDSDLHPPERAQIHP